MFTLRYNLKLNVLICVLQMHALMEITHRKYPNPNPRGHHFSDFFQCLSVLLVLQLHINHTVDISTLLCLASFD